MTPTPAVGDSAHNPIPRKAYVKGLGICRVLEQSGKDHFYLVDNRDIKHLVHRNRISFRK